MIAERAFMKNPPRVSVVMATYNRAPYLCEAIESILSQTLGDFEFIIVNDGSTDCTQEILESYTDERLHIISQENQGATVAFNRAFGVARGDYLAQMADDDISLPDRFARQVAYLDRYPHVVLVGTSYEMIDPHGSTLKVVPVLCHDEWIHKELLFYSPFGAGSVMVRKEVLLAVGGYNPVNEPAQDYALWVKIGEQYPLANLPQVLYRYRVHPSSITAQRREAQVRNSKFISTCALERRFADQRYLEPRGSVILSECEDDIYRGEREQVYANVCFRLGNEYSLRGRQREARQEFQLAVRYAPERWDYWVGLMSTFLPAQTARRLRALRKHVQVALTIPGENKPDGRI